MAQSGGGGGQMMAPQPQSTVVVMGGGNQPNVKYCGIVTHIISWFFPCICCCPIDRRPKQHNNYIEMAAPPAPHAMHQPAVAVPAPAADAKAVDAQAAMV